MTRISCAVGMRNAKLRNHLNCLLLFFSPSQTVNFTEPFYARPVVLVTAKRSDNNNNNSNLSGSRCNAVIAWVEVRNTSCYRCVSFGK